MPCFDIPKSFESFQCIKTTSRLPLQRLPLVISTLIATNGIKVRTTVLKGTSTQKEVDEKGTVKIKVTVHSQVCTNSRDSTIHDGFEDIAIVRGTMDDGPAVFSLLDTAVEWLVSHGRTGQWGTAPFSGNPRRAEQLNEFATTGLGLWLAIRVVDGTPMDRETPGSVVGALAVGDRMPYVTPVSEPELYVRLLITDRQWAGKGVGKRLLEHARGLARGAGASLLRVDCYAGDDGKLVQYYESQGFEKFEALKVGVWPCQVLAQHLHDVKGE